MKKLMKAIVALFISTLLVHNVDAADKGDKKLPVQQIEVQSNKQHKQKQVKVERQGQRKQEKTGTPVKKDQKKKTKKKSNEVSATLAKKEQAKKATEKQKPQEAEKGKPPVVTNTPSVTIDKTTQNVQKSPGHEASENLIQAMTEIEGKMSVDALIEYEKMKAIALEATNIDLAVCFMAAVLKVAEEGDVEKAIKAKNVLALVALTASPDLWKGVNTEALTKITITGIEKNVLEQCIAKEEFKKHKLNVSMFTVKEALQSSPSSAQDSAKKVSNWTTKEYVAAATASIIGISLIATGIRYAIRAKHKTPDTAYPFNDLSNLGLSN